MTVGATAGTPITTGLMDELQLLPSDRSLSVRIFVDHTFIEVNVQQVCLLVQMGMR